MLFKVKLLVDTSTELTRYFYLKNNLNKYLKQKLQYLNCAIQDI